MAIQLPAFPFKGSMLKHRHSPRICEFSTVNVVFVASLRGAGDLEERVLFVSKYLEKQNLGFVSFVRRRMLMTSLTVL
jgi:hypothetical protein